MKKMREYDNRKPLLSIHLPKCGGTSFIKVLETWYAENLFLHYYNEKEGKPPAKYNLPPGSCVHGHFGGHRGIGADDYYPNIDQRIIIFRDPLEIAVSNYFFAKRRIEADNNYRDGKRTQNKLLPIEEYLANEKTFIFSFLPGGIQLTNYASILDSHFLFVGVMEQMESTMRCLSTVLGKEYVEIPHTNKSPRSADVSEAAIQKFRSRNLLAFNVYEYAVNRLESLKSNLS